MMVNKLKKCREASHFGFLILEKLMGRLKGSDTCRRKNVNFMRCGIADEAAPMWQQKNELQAFKQDSRNPINKLVTPFADKRKYFGSVGNAR